ncbi:hypothetical protein RUND412_002414 [Rhizina undulata]
MSQYYRRPSAAGVSESGNERMGGGYTRGRREEKEERSPVLLRNDVREIGIGEAWTTDFASPPAPINPQNIPLSQHPRRMPPQGSAIPHRPAPPPPILMLPAETMQGRDRAAPQRPQRPKFAPSLVDSSEGPDLEQHPAFAYRPPQSLIKPQPRYSHSLEDGGPSSPGSQPSMSSPKSNFVGFDPAQPNQPASPSTRGSLGVIPNFPAVPPPATSVSNQNRRSNSGPPPSARRIATSSHYSQQAIGVSPIPEESSPDRHISYASSTAIPSSWAAGPVEYYRDEDFSDSDDDNMLPIEGIDEEKGLVRQASLGRKTRPTITEIRNEDKGLVRQASLGRKSKPTITEIRNPDKRAGAAESSKTAQSKSQKSSNDSLRSSNVSGLVVDAGVGASVGAVGRNSPAEKSSPTLQAPLAWGLPSPVPGTRAAQSLASTNSSNSSPLAQPPMSFTESDSHDHDLEKPPLPSAPETMSPALAKELGISLNISPVDENVSKTKLPVGSGKMTGRRIPPRLNLDAVRDAEARGSLTSLPDLIKRATKLAAVLETGRPDSRWGIGGSWKDKSSSSQSRSNGRDTDSISDILASFPPPALAQPNGGKNGGRNSRHLSAWPLPEDFPEDRESSVETQAGKRGRRICGLPLWAFILLVILALLVICAAVIVPLQLVNLSKGNNGSSNETLVAKCRQTLTCENGGENIATSDFCGCVCTNGFSGSNCTEQEDTACTSSTLQDLNGELVEGIQNVTLGSALPRLFKKSQASYNIQLDPVMILARFSSENITCTAQNALVTFNQEAIPNDASTRRRWEIEDLEAFEKRWELEDLEAFEKRQLLTASATVESALSAATSTNTATAGATKTAAVDEDVVDFARVAVLYLTQTDSLNVAENVNEVLQESFTSGVYYGNVSVGNNVTVEFDSRSIRLADGDVVGEAVLNATTSSTASA